MSLIVVCWTCIELVINPPPRSLRVRFQDCLVILKHSSLTILIKYLTTQYCVTRHGSTCISFWSKPYFALLLFFLCFLSWFCAFVTGTWWYLCPAWYFLWESWNETNFKELFVGLNNPMANAKEWMREKRSVF